MANHPRTVSANSDPTPRLVPVAVLPPVTKVQLMKTYDEETELTRYVYEQFRHLRNEQEVILAEVFAVQCKNRKAQTRTFEQLGISPDDPIVRSTLRDGMDKFREKVRKRILKEHASELFVNRCPTCSKIVATPKASQCLWCGFDWH